MTKVAIVTDSTAYLPENLIEKYQISIVPMELIWGDKTYLDGIDIQPNEFYQRLSTATVLPTTSQGSILNFKNTFERLLEQGNEVLTILISSKLSGTIDSAYKAREYFPDSPIEIVDSYTTSMAMGFQVLAVAQAAEQGANLEECRQLAEATRQQTGLVVAVDTLEFLYRGGRIGGGTRFLGSALNIKPIVEVIGGRVEAVERVRTRKKSLLRLVELVAQKTKGKDPIHLAILHANAEEDARFLIEESNRVIHPIETLFSTVSPVIGNHTGPGSVGIAYLTGL